jgi:hypothetical protein
MGNTLGANGFWSTASSWAASLDPYGSGITGWHLPTLSPINGSTFDTTPSTNASTNYRYAGNLGQVGSSGNPVSEAGNMYYVILGDLGYYSQDNGPVVGCT